MTDFESAKAFLLQAGSGGRNVYDHLSEVITRLLDDRPADAVAVLEDVSHTVKASQFDPKTDTIKDQPAPAGAVQLAETQAKLYQPEDVEDEDDAEPVVPNVLESGSRFAEAGVGVGAEETFRIYLALKQLAAEQPLENVRFWGKIFGLHNDYIVAEAKYREGEEPQPEDEPEPEPAAEDEDEETDPADQLPQSQHKAPKPVPAEDYGTGANKKAYFVCSEPGSGWTLLPNVSPAQIAVSRQIKKFFTGNLDTPVVSYPPFEGTEASLLRAQIARITAATHVSPLGLYTFDEEDEDEDEDRDTYIEDEEFEGKTRGELLDPELSGWAHHVQYLLPQGRCKWVNPNPKDDEDEEEDEDEDEEDEEEEPETGPPLLQPLQNDAELDGQPAWTPRVASQFAGRFSSVVIASNRWPGAYAYALPNSKEYDNVYVGWGHKFTSEAFNPVLPPAPQAQFPTSEEVAEGADPTREEEEEFEAAQAEAEEDDDDEEDED
eukprot:m.359841 g.359841  ORF g.359841 m.359841 type:complete len:491 (-) comp19951_c4_seq2:66-1538(-)